MRRNGITSGISISKRIKNFLYLIYWEQFCLPINFLIFHIKFTIFKVHRRSNQTLITHSSKRIDTLGVIEIIERGRDNMEEFVKMVPDECLLDLSFRWYCVRER